MNKFTEEELYTFSLEQINTVTMTDNFEYNALVARIKSEKAGEIEAALVVETVEVEIAEVLPEEAKTEEVAEEIKEAVVETTQMTEEEAAVMKGAVAKKIIKK